ncbi:hypothetical protein ACFLS1_10550 [Verrucomicrobiota bacterium]
MIKKAAILSLALSSLLFSGCVSYCPRGCEVHMDHKLANSVRGMYKGTVDDITLVIHITSQPEYCIQYLYENDEEYLSADVKWKIESNGTLTFWSMFNPFSEDIVIPALSDTTTGIVAKDGKTITLIFDNEQHFEVKSIIEERLTR